MEDNAFEHVNLSGVDVEVVEQEKVHALFDVTLGLEKTATGYQAYWKYNTDLFEPKTMERMRDHLLNLIDDALARPQLPLDQLMISSDAERAMLLRDFDQSRQADIESLDALNWLMHWAERRQTPWL